MSLGDIFKLALQGGGKGVNGVDASSVITKESLKKALESRRDGELWAFSDQCFLSLPYKRDLPYSSACSSQCTIFREVGT